MERCNGLNDDCANGVPAHETDADTDGYLGCEGDGNDGNASVHPGATELCNGTDDNCEAGVDEGCPCAAGESRPCGSDVGECVSGTQSCVAGTWGSCDGATEPIPEQCNGLDDDCVDGVPAEEADGDDDDDRICDGDGDDADDTIHPTAAEACNGVDDDCDGDTDEECGCSEGESRACGTDVGECEVGIERCEAGTWADCDGDVGPVAEICGDGLDNDCDAATDEGCGTGGAGVGGGSGGSGVGAQGGDAGGSDVGPAAQGVLTGSCGCRLVGADARPSGPARIGGGSFALGALGVLSTLRRRRCAAPERRAAGSSRPSNGGAHARGTCAESAVSAPAAP
jgi:hypothetical protein